MLKELGVQFMKTNQSIDDYLDSLPVERSNVLRKVRASVLEVVPDATEGFSYGMPAFKYRGKYLIAYSNFKDHMSVFPGGHVISVHSDLLVDFKSSKGTVQFTLDHPLPDTTLNALVLARKSDIEAELS